MPRSIHIEVEPLVLKYARYCSKYDLPTAAKKLKFDEARLRELEDQKTTVRLTELKKMAEVYQMPLAYFLLKNAPKDMIVPSNFRIVYASEQDALTHEVMLAVRNARYVQSILQQLSATIKYDFNAAELTDDPEKIAAYFRGLLKVDIAVQKKWNAPAVALKGWKDAVESLGIFILQKSLPKDDISAFCLVDEKPYIINLNSAEHENRRIFSLFHEIGHILLNISGVCTPDDLSRNSYEYVQIEKFCNHFAAALLVPADEFAKEDIVVKLSKIPFATWNGEDVKSLATKYGVSQEVVYRRLVAMSVITDAQYTAKRNDLIKGFEEYKKNDKKKGVKIPQYRKILSKNGRAYSTFVLENLHANKITLADAADYLRTNTRHIATVEAHI